MNRPSVAQRTLLICLLNVALLRAAPAADSSATAPPPPPPPILISPAQAAAMQHEHQHDAPVASPATQREVPPDSVDAATVTYGSLKGQALSGYFAKPRNAHGPLPGVILYHEWWGLNDNIRSVARQLAYQGYNVLAADMYFGQAATDPQTAMTLMKGALSDAMVIDRNIEAAYDYLHTTAKASRIGTLGWCFGGAMSFEAAQVLSGKTAATVIYYGTVNDKPEVLAKITAPLLMVFGGQDTSTPADMALTLQRGLQAAGKPVETHVYPDAGHAFANPSGKNYNAVDAEDAWTRTLAFLEKTLKSPP